MIQRKTPSRFSRTVAFDVERSNRRFRLRLARYPFQSEMLSRHLPDRPSTVLDAGCGRGRLPRYFQKWGAPEKQVRFVGLDVRADRVEQSRAYYDDIRECDLTAGLPFYDDRFDAVVCEQVLEHFTDAEVSKTLREFRRVLKPGGVLLVGVPIFPAVALWVMPAVLRVRGVLSRKAHDHVQRLNLRALRRILTENGFRVEIERGFRAFSFFYDWLEDHAWYYRLHQSFGRRFPSLCVEVTVVARATTSS